MTSHYVLINSRRGLPFVFWQRRHNAAGDLRLLRERSPTTFPPQGGQRKENPDLNIRLPRGKDVFTSCGVTRCGLISSDCRFFPRATCMFPLPVLFRSPSLFITMELGGVPAEASVISKILRHRKGGFYHMKGKGGK